MAIIEHTDCFMCIETLADGSTVTTIEHIEPDGTLYRLSATLPSAPMQAMWMRTESDSRLQYSDDGVTWRDEP